MSKKDNIEQKAGTNEVPASITAIVVKSTIHSKPKNIFIVSTETTYEDSDSDGFIDVKVGDDTIRLRAEDLKTAIPIRIFPEDLLKLQEFLK